MVYLLGKRARALIFLHAQGTQKSKNPLNIYYFWEVKTVANSKRTKIILACTECKQRNYFLTKDKKLHPDRMELNKYCRFCKKHTAHKETK